MLDASAVLALLRREPGHELVSAVIESGSAAVISTVNLSEVVANLADAAMPGEAIREARETLGVEAVPFNAAMAYQAGLLRPSTRARGLSLGDRACIALGQELACSVLTADRGWAQLTGLGIRVRSIR